MALFIGQVASGVLLYLACGALIDAGHAQWGLFVAAVAFPIHSDLWWVARGGKIGSRK